MGPPQTALDWRGWLQRWDAQQTGYIPDREERFGAMLDALEAVLPEPFVALDLACGPGSLSQRMLARFPQARCVAVDLDPVLLAIGQGALGSSDGRLCWIEADLRRDEWAADLGAATFDAAVSTTALHWLSDEHLGRLYGHLGRLVRPGGIVLNGDRMRYGPDLPTLQRAADIIAVRAETAGYARPGGEDWEDWTAWWRALSAEPALAALLAERARRFPDNVDDARAPTAATHVAALHAAGFREVDTVWQHWQSRLLMAVR